MKIHDDSPPPPPPPVRSADPTDLFGGGCIFGHSWSNWKVIENRPFGFMSWMLVQQRTCKFCNKTQIETSIN